MSSHVCETRQRKPRLSEAEMNMLADTIVLHAGELFSNDQRRQNQLRKNSIWEEVAHKVPAVRTTPHTVRDCHKHWDDLHLGVWNLLSAHRRQSMATGGGTSSPIRLMPWEEKCSRVLHMESIEGIGTVEARAGTPVEAGTSSNNEGSQPSTSKGTTFTEDNAATTATDTTAPPIQAAQPAVVTTAAAPIQAALPAVVTTAAPTQAAQPAVVTTAAAPIQATLPAVVTTTAAPIQIALLAVVTTAASPIQAALPAVVTPAAAPIQQHYLQRCYCPQAKQQEEGHYPHHISHMHVARIPVQRIQLSMLETPRGTPPTTPAMSGLNSAQLTSQAHNVRPSPVSGK
ncbi:angiomotin-like [Ambystoma mexicanum]|uniref:angiomotin-like n=1 Tax=Ambystoma mexicanum TaxID=8296 RepID=UPI0037E8D4D3